MSILSSIQAFIDRTADEAPASYGDLRAVVHVPDCDIAGPPSQFFRLRRGRDSVPVYFSLTPQREGEIPIRVTLYQAFNQIGSARLRTRTDRRGWSTAGSVREARKMFAKEAGGDLGELPTLMAR